MLSAFPLRAAFARRLSPLGFILAMALATSTCATPTDAPDPPEENPPAQFEGSLDLSGPGTLQINQSELYTVTARDTDGKAVSPWPVGFRSSDQSVAVVSASGVVTARSRGTAIISATRGSASDSVTVDVEARLALNPSAGWEWATSITPTVGESIQLEAQYVDVDGKTIGPAAASAWSTSDPAVATVTPDGLVTTHMAYHFVTITASTPDGAVSRTLLAEDVQPPRLVRIANGAMDVGPVTFKIHGQPDITLDLGETVDVMVTSSGIYATVEGIPAAELERHTISADLTWGPTLSLYAVHSSRFGGLVGGWSTTDPIPPGMSQVRLVQGGSLPVVYLRDPGGTTAGAPNHCYFDPGEISQYFTRTSGDFDLLMQTKVGLRPDPGMAYVRMPSSVPDGQSLTIVVTGNTTSTSSYIAFMDP